METIKNTKKKNATFSRQKLALFKNACKLEMECNTVIEKFKNEHEISDNIDEGDKAGLEKLHKQLDSTTKKIRAEKKLGKEYQKWLESAGCQRYEKAIEELTHKELKELESELEIFNGQIQCNINHMLASKTLISLSKDKGDKNNDKDN